MAEAHALILKAKGQYDSARAAEERTRRLASEPEEGPDERLEALRDAYAEVGVPVGDGGFGAQEELPGLHPSVEPSHAGKSEAYAMKFGLQ